MNFREVGNSMNEMKIINQKMNVANDDDGERKCVKKMSNATSFFPHFKLLDTIGCVCVCKWQLSSITFIETSRAFVRFFFLSFFFIFFC